MPDDSANHSINTWGILTAVVVVALAAVLAGVLMAAPAPLPRITPSQGAYHRGERVLVQVGKWAAGLRWDGWHYVTILERQRDGRWLVRYTSPHTGEVADFPVEEWRIRRSSLSAS